MDPRDYISEYEGREEAQAPIQRPRCGSCGQEVDDVSRCVRDATLMVGRCCETYIDHRCPDCGSDHLRWEEYDYGTCSETGYHDAGVRAICEECGCNCDERDTEVKIGPIPSIQFSVFPELERKPVRMEQTTNYLEARHGKA